MTNKSNRRKETFGQRLKGWLKARNLKQTEFAEKLGVDRADLNRLLNDRRSPREAELVWLAKFFSVSIEALVADVELKPKARKVVGEAIEKAKRIEEAEKAKALAEAKLAEANRAREEAEKARDKEIADLKTALLETREELNESKQKWSRKFKNLRKETRTLREHTEEGASQDETTVLQPFPLVSRPSPFYPIQSLPKPNTMIEATPTTALSRTNQQEDWLGKLLKGFGAVALVFGAAMAGGAIVNALVGDGDE